MQTSSVLDSSISSVEVYRSDLSLINQRITKVLGITIHNVTVNYIDEKWAGSNK